MTRDASGKEWVMVPVEATIAQRNAGTFYSYPRDTANEVYAAMLAARPQFVPSDEMVRECYSIHMREGAGHEGMRAALEAALNGGAK